MIAVTNKRLIFRDLLDLSLEDAIKEIKGFGSEYQIIEIDSNKVIRESKIGLVVKGGNVVGVRLVEEVERDIDKSED